MIAGAVDELFDPASPQVDLIWTTHCGEDGESRGLSDALFAEFGMSRNGRPDSRRGNDALG